MERGEEASASSRNEERLEFLSTGREGETDFEREKGKTRKKKNKTHGQQPNPRKRRRARSVLEYLRQREVQEGAQTDVKEVSSTT